MLKAAIGKIQVMGVKDVFPEEDRDFTPWLNNNLDLLSAKLGLEIKDGTIETSVGEFSCDIFARDYLSEKAVIVENQYGHTNHDHLGKIITYSAGNDAKIVIWIAERFRDEHQKALEWLNENSDPESGTSFFGVEIKVIRIDNSPPAPDFDVIVKPNNWERNLRKNQQTESDYHKRNREFFTRIVDEYAKVSPTWKRITPQPFGWSGFGAGITGLKFNWVIKGGNRLAIELTIDTGDEARNESIFLELQKHRENLEKQLGVQLVWEIPDDARVRRIYQFKTLRGNLKSLTEDDYPEILKWSAESMKRFASTFTPYISSIRNDL